jgi:ubiquinone/menaquinone biosynthesis C-methylase UbiE
MAANRDWKATFEDSYEGAPSSVAERVWRQAFGDEYPEGTDPYSYISVSELERFAEDLRVDEGQMLADLGCGRGGPGLWVAAATGANLVGVDISRNALEAARRRAEAMGLEGRTEFREGSFENTGLEAGNVDAVMSVDALLFAPDKAAAASELRRIVRPGGRVMFTSWDYHSQPVGRPPQVNDHRPLLSDSGFDVLAYDETDDWQRRLAETAAGLMENVEELAAESGVDVAGVRASIEEMRRR